MVFSNDNLMLYMRNDSKKGVKVISIQDGVEVHDIKTIHTNPILNILLTKDGH